jgi:hypothetical protein
MTRRHASGATSRVYLGGFADRVLEEQEIGDGDVSPHDPRVLGPLQDRRDDWLYLLASLFDAGMGRAGAEEQLLQPPVGDLQLQRALDEARERFPRVGHLDAVGLSATATTSFIASHGGPTAGTVAAAAVHGYTTAFWWAAGIFFLGALPTALLLRSGTQRRAPEGVLALAH